ncbi:MAG: L-seryl-tRNA(Sec) selenium transferase [Rhodanobacteraceae bacterium]
MATASRITPAAIPSLDRVLREPELASAIDRYGRDEATHAVRTELATLRDAALAQTLDAASLAVDGIAERVADALARRHAPRLRAVFNLTGTVVHTNLGRSVLPDLAIDAVARVMRAPVNLEFDLDRGMRGDRDDAVSDLVRELTGAEDATVVNNNAAAVLLVLATLSRGRETVVSRGELVEIGGSFRIPDVMRSAGAKLVEVGTTNRTHLADYANAIGERTAVLMKVHASNYAITGFTTSVALGEIATLAHAHALVAVEDLGSGSLVDLARFGLGTEPTVRESIAAGADLVTFSGDKLLGGPQAGIIAGRADLVARLKKHPLRRALRPDKLTLAALEAVLALYRDPDRLAERLPSLRQLSRDEASIRAQAERLLPALAHAFGENCATTAVAMTSQIGSGALPVDRLPSHGIAVRARHGASLGGLERALRALPRPVLGRVAEKTLWLDLRCLDESDEAAFLAQLSRLEFPAKR